MAKEQQGKVGAANHESLLERQQGTKLQGIMRHLFIGGPMDGKRIAVSPNEQTVHTHHFPPWNDKPTDDKTFNWAAVFKGEGVDVGSGNDPLIIKECGGIRHFDLPDGGGDDLTKYLPVRDYDFVHGSQVLEHALDPEVMLRSWIKILKPK